MLKLLMDWREEISELSLHLACELTDEMTILFGVVLRIHTHPGCPDSQHCCWLRALPNITTITSELFRPKDVPALSIG